MRFVVLAMALCLVSAGRAHADVPPTQNLHVSIVSCAADASVPPEVSIFGNSTPGQREYTPIVATATPVLGEPGTYQASFQLADGIYDVIAKGKKCTSPGGEPVTIFPSKERNVYLATISSCCLLVDYGRGSIGVSVPSGLTVDMISTTRKILPLNGRRDGDAIYFDAIQSDRYILEITASHVTACVPVNVPFVLKGFQKFIDLSGVDLALLLREAATRERYWTCIPGTSHEGHR